LRFVLGNTDYGAVDPGNCVAGTPTYIKGEQKSPPERVAGWPPAGVWGCWATRTDTEPLRCGGPTIDPQAGVYRSDEKIIDSPMEVDDSTENIIDSHPGIDNRQY
jgi:hypothetical protein